MRLFIQFLILFVTTTVAFAQQTKTIHIDASQTNVLKLSDIAESTIPIFLNKDISVAMGAFWTGKYLFIASLQYVQQYDISGKFIRTISCNGNYIEGITGDLSRNALYISVNIPKKNKCEVWCYDYYGKLKKKIPLKNPSVVNCLYHNNYLWILSERFTETKAYGYYSYIDIATNKEYFLPETYEKAAEQNSSGEYIGIGFVGTLSISNNYLYANWGDNILWCIDSKVKPAFKFEVAPKYREKLFCLKGIIGNYLFFNYYLNDNDSNLFLQHQKTRKIYNVKYNGKYGNYTQGAIDDIYNSGYFDITKNPLTQEGYFWFIKDMTHGETLKNQQIKGKQCLFIVKVKQ